MEAIHIAIATCSVLRYFYFKRQGVWVSVCEGDRVSGEVQYKWSDLTFDFSLVWPKLMMH